MRNVALWGSVVAVLGVGCVDDNVSMFIVGNVMPEVTDDGCVFDSNSTALRSAGTLDIRETNGYFVWPALRNQLQRRARSGVAETNGIQITAAEVTIRAANGAPYPFAARFAEIFDVDPRDVEEMPTTFRIPASGYVQPANSPDAPGVGITQILAVPPQIQRTFAALADEFPGIGQELIIVSIRLIGQTLGNISIETGEFDFPINLCDGCLPSCGACNVGQDEC